MYLMFIAVQLLAVFGISLDPPVEEEVLDTEAFAVVELFTSQGCSSCPPADRVLKHLGSDAKWEGKKVYRLSFHVTYWDYLGWKDPYGQAAFSTRQRTYAQKLRDGVYTPQMFVNGKRSFVGSDRGQAEAEIRGALAAKPDLQLDLSVNAEKDQLKINYELLGDASGTYKLNLALVQEELSNAVARGENRGRTLSHSHVVRVFDTQTLKEEKAGAATLAVPDDLQGEDWQLIAYVQEAKSLAVVAATDWTR